MNQPRLTETFSTYSVEAQGGANVGVGLTNIAKAIMYAADKVAEAINNHNMQSGSDS